MAEKPAEVKSPAELRTGFDTTRARITTHVNEIEGRLRAHAHSILGEPLPEPPPSMNLLDAVRLVNGLKGAPAVAVVAGAIAGFVTMRRWAPRRSNRPDA